MIFAREAVQNQRSILHGRIIVLCVLLHFLF